MGIAPIARHATADGLCHDECQAWKDRDGTCPWALMRGDVESGLLNWGEVGPGLPCPVVVLLRLIGRSPSVSATALPTCETCPYFAAADETCRVEPPRGGRFEVQREGKNDMAVFPPVGRQEWCSKHPKLEALRMRGMTAPVQAMMGDMATMFERLKGGT